MRSLRRPFVWLGIVGVFASGAGVAYATQAGGAEATSVIEACVKQNGQITLVGAAGECGQNETRISWNVVGPPGEAGPQGPQGLQGETGPAGPAGATGATGAAGPPGATGPAGPQGPPGADGADGVDGVDGLDGEDGSDGADGADGESVVSTAVAVGDANCPSGGTRFVVGAVTSFACNGADGTGAGFSGSYTSPNGKFSLRITNQGIVLAGPPGSVTIDRTLVRVNEGPWNGLYR